MNTTTKETRNKRTKKCKCIRMKILKRDKKKRSRKIIKEKNNQWRIERILKKGRRKEERLKKRKIRRNKNRNKETDKQIHWEAQLHRKKEEKEEESDGRTNKNQEEIRKRSITRKKLSKPFPTFHVCLSASVSLCQRYITHCGLTWVFVGRVCVCVCWQWRSYLWKYLEATTGEFNASFSLS